jgi:hypothetical protein
MHDAETLIAGIHRDWGEAQGNYDEFRFFTGLRPSEQIALVLNDVDLMNGVISVNKARVSGVDRCQTKTGDDRAEGAAEVDVKAIKRSLNKKTALLTADLAVDLPVAEVVSNPSAPASAPPAHFDIRINSLITQKKMETNPTDGELAGVAGFEPTNGGIKRLNKISNLTYSHGAIRVRGTRVTLDTITTAFRTERRLRKSPRNFRPWPWPTVRPTIRQRHRMDPLLHNYSQDTGTCHDFRTTIPRHQRRCCPRIAFARPRSPNKRPGHSVASPERPGASESVRRSNYHQRQSDRWKSTLVPMLRPTGPFPDRTPC